jgi:hypothetical protein
MASLALAAALLVFGRLDGLPHVLMVPRFDSFSHSAWIKKKKSRFLSVPALMPLWHKSYCSPHLLGIVGKGYLSDCLTKLLMTCRIRADGLWFLFLQMLMKSLLGSASNRKAKMLGLVADFFLCSVMFGF